MPSTPPGPERDDDDIAIATDEGDQQAEKATHLAERAGKSVDRRYDATKEIHHDEGE